MTDLIRLLDIRETPISMAEVYDAVADGRCGGIAVFVGTVREEDGGKGVDGLGYSAHPSAVDEMRKVARSVAERFDVEALAVVHRVGELAIGDLAVVAAAAAIHRGDAFDACEALIDDLKAGVPIWKHQQFSDGTDEWVGTP